MGSFQYPSIKEYLQFCIKKLLYTTLGSCHSRTTTARLHHLVESGAESEISRSLTSRQLYKIALPMMLRTVLEIAKAIALEVFGANAMTPEYR